jgi:uncharacterized hydrophobic protein (TIGR00271 family)
MSLPLPERLAAAPAIKALTAPSDGKYRILLPLDRRGRRPGLLRLALTLARACEGEVLALHVITPEDERKGVEWELPEVDAEQLANVPHQILTYHADTIAKGILTAAREQACSLILLSWRGSPRALRSKLGNILDPVIEDAPCDVAILKGDLVHEWKQDAARRMLLASAGGPHAVAAARMAFSLARYTGGQVTLLTILGEEADQASADEADEVLDKLLLQATDLDAPLPDVERRIIRGGDIDTIITNAAREHDLVFLGATTQTVLSQLLLGSRAERIAKAIPVPVVVVKRYRGKTHAWLRRLWRTLDRLLPSAMPEEQLDTYKRLRRGARGTVDFFIMILLSVIIATMGLLLNSAAVIIGAMLVAPLMTPILAVGLGVVMGDNRLIRIAGITTVLGVLLAIVVAAALTWVAPLAIFTTEIEGRTQPNLFDLTVALASGAAGAYGISRKSVAAALPGVAIAAALVPPLSVIGICLATGRWEAAWGSTLLFGTNLVAISLAAAVTYMLLGFFPPEEEQKRFTVLRRSFLVILALLFLVSIPLTRGLAEAVDDASVERLNRSVQDSLTRELNEEPGIWLASFETDFGPTIGPREPVSVRVVVHAVDPVDSTLIPRLQERVERNIGRDASISLGVIQIREIRGDGPAAPPE